MRTIGNAWRGTSSLIQTPLEDLSERINVRYFETARDKYGNIINCEEQERCRVWAKVLPLTARNNFGIPEQTNKRTYRVIIRYRADIKPKDEIMWRGRRLKIISPPYDAESRKIFTVFECEEVVENGTT